MRRRRSRFAPLLATLVAAAAPAFALLQEPAPPATASPAAAASGSGAVAANGRPIYHVERIHDPVSIDGRLDDRAWSGPPTLTLDYEVRPGENTPAAVQTEIWIAYDDSNLYVAARAHDPRPGEIRAHLRDRDNAYSDDFVGVVLDTFDDERRASEFFVNPLGVQMDLSQNDVTGNEDDSWDTLWASAGRVTESGYEVEMAIPFSSLRFPRSKGGEQTWGIDAVRAYPRGQSYMLASNPRPRGRNCYLCGEAKLTGFVGITPGRNIELDPTVTASREDSRDTTDESFTREQKAEPGITGRWGITPGMTLNATVNPDFSQVEADAAQLSVNTQFALFYPEKRPFFLEGADLFDTKIGAVYTRNIADPSWGVKLTGKEGASGLGLLAARDTVTNLYFPSSQSTSFGTIDEPNQSSVLRYRHDLSFGGGSAAGGIFTDREGADYHNRVLGGDGLFRWGPNALRVELLGSDTQYPLATAEAFDQPTDTLRGFATRIVYQRTVRDWMGYVQYNEITPDFRADLGFIPQADYRKGYGILERYLYSDQGQTWWTRQTWGIESTWTYDHAGNPLQRQLSPYFGVNGPRQSFVNLYLGTGDSFYGTRSFDRNFLNYSAEVQAVPSVYLSIDGRVGQEIDYANAQQGHIVRAHPTLRWDAGTHLRLNLGHSYETLTVHGGRLYTANLSDLRATYQINVRTFVRVVTQYLDVERDPSLYSFATTPHSRDLFNQLLFSYKLNPQTVLFLGYSDTYAGSDVAGEPLGQTGRTLFFKVGYAFVL